MLTFFPRHFGRTLLLGLLSLLLTCGLWGGQPAVAHEPHDVVVKVLTSATYSQDQTLLMLIRGSLFRSTDGGESWTRIVQGLDNKFNFVDLAVDLERGTAYLVSPGDGVYASADGGLSWQRANAGLAALTLTQVETAGGETLIADDAGQLYRWAAEAWELAFTADSGVSAIALTPTGAVIADDQGQLYTSDDRQTWTAAATVPSAVTDLVIEEETVWVATAANGVWQSADGGQTATDSSTGLADLQIQTLTQQANTLIATTWHEGPFQWAAGTWQPLTEGLVKDRQADQFEQAHFRNTALSDQFEQDGTAFVSGFNGLFKTTDGGQTWVEIPSFSKGLVIGLDVSPNFANDRTLAVVNYMGEAYRSTDGGETWTALSTGFEIPRFTEKLGAVDLNYDQRRMYHMAFSPDYGADDTLFASVLWNKIMRYQGDGWQITAMPETTRSQALAPSPNIAQDSTVFVATQKGPVFVSRDRGRSFKPTGGYGAQLGNESPSLVVSPDFANDQTLFASGEGGIHKSTDGGKTWIAPDQQPMAVAGSLRLAISPDYATDQTVLVSSNQGLFATTNGGENWAPVSLSSGIQNPPPNDAYVEAAVFSPDYANDQTYLVSLRGQGLLKTADGGQRFQPVGDASLPIAMLNNFESSSMPIVFSPDYANDQTLYGLGAAEAGVFRSTDGGNTWTLLPIERDPIFQQFNQQQYTIGQRASLALYVYRSKLIKGGVAAISALLAYLLAGVLRLEKRLPLPRLGIKLGAAAIAFVGVLGLLMVV
ncbi:MAG: hypothetical protein AAFZ80_00505 [Cyanobacteria bacterium P01_A01_bin.105]